MTFEALYEQHQKRVYNLCLKMVRNHAIAEELAQDAWVKVYKHLDGFKGQCAVTTWLHQIAANECLMYLRRCKIVQFDSIEQSESGEQRVDIPSSTRPAAEVMTLQAALTKLHKDAPRQALAFMMAEVDGYSGAEVAETMGVTVGCVKAQLSRARGTLRSALGAAA